MERCGLTMQELAEIESRAIASSDDWQLVERGDQKYYGTMLTSQSVANPVIFWGTSEDDYPFGDAAHSEREIEDVYSHNAMGGHYESQRDLANAVFMLHAREDVLRLIAELRKGLSVYYSTIT